MFATGLGFIADSFAAFLGAFSGDFDFLGSAFFLGSGFAFSGDADF